MHLIAEALQLFTPKRRAIPGAPLARLERARHRFAGREFVRKDYRALFPHISSSTASRDLRRGVDTGKLHHLGEHALTRYRFVPGK